VVEASHNIRYIKPRPTGHSVQTFLSVEVGQFLSVTKSGLYEKLKRINSRSLDHKIILYAFLSEEGRSK
jgi:hypothetical protein